MSDAEPTVFLVDDDPGVLRALARLLGAAGFSTRAFANARDFLAHHDPEEPGCLVLDLAMPGLSGLEIQQALVASGGERPIIFMSGQGDIPQSVQAMKAGAVDFLTKPIDADDLIASVRSAIETDLRARDHRTTLRSVQERLARLTTREREVFEHVVAGRPNKQIALALGIVEKTVKVHRGRVMEKMEAQSLAELVQIATRIGLV